MKQQSFYNVTLLLYFFHFVKVVVFIYNLLHFIYYLAELSFLLYVERVQNKSILSPLTWTFFLRCFRLC